MDKDEPGGNGGTPSSFLPSPFLPPHHPTSSSLPCPTSSSHARFRGARGRDLDLFLDFPGSDYFPC
eukprot:4911219-Pyramimonas_sp.AAC.1